MKELIDKIKSEIAKIEELVDFLELDLDEKNDEEKEKILKEISTLL